MVRLPLVFLRWKVELREQLETIWENRWCGVALAGTFTIAVACLFYWVPPPGISVAVMGAVAAIMAARTKATGAEKATWMLIISALLVIEIAAINKERYFARLNEDIRVTQEQRKFREIARDIRDAATKTTQQLDATMAKENEVLGTTQQVADLSKKNLENITGGKSFAIVTPQVWSGIVPIPLSIYNYGNDTLTGVTVSIYGKTEWNNPRGFFDAPTINVGTLHAGEMKLLKESITPDINSEFNENGLNIDRFQIHIAAQNFTVVEYLDFRQGKKLPWTFRYLVTRQFIKSGHGKTINFGYETMSKTKDWMGEN
jgi:hypothetical protein